jgi:glycosyltransferase involved in cell wall biosynthesis
MIRHHRLVIGVPVFNEVHFLRQCLESLTSQSDQDFEVLVADNASTDGSGQIAKEFAEKNRHIHVVRHPITIGAAKNFLFLLEKTDSPFFQWLGGHDLLEKDYIRTVMREFSDCPALSLVYTNTQWVNESGRCGPITSGGSFASSANVPPLQRYIDAVSGPWGECTAVNGVFSRKAISGTRLHVFRGPDHLILSRAQFFGPVRQLSEPLYFRRSFEKRTTTQAERLTGSKNKTLHTEKSVWPLIFWQTKNYFSLPCSMSSKLSKLPLFIIALERGYSKYFQEYYRCRAKIERVYRRLTG